MSEQTLIRPDTVPALPRGRGIRLGLTRIAYETRVYFRVQSPL